MALFGSFGYGPHPQHGIQSIRPILWDFLSLAPGESLINYSGQIYVPHQ